MTQETENNDNLYLCLYQFKGQETEGHLQSNEKFICRAKDKVEALFKYAIWEYWRSNRLYPPSFNSLTEAKKIGLDEGWGLFAYKLAEHEDNKERRDDSPAFYEFYKKFDQ